MRRASQGSRIHNRSLEDRCARESTERERVQKESSRAGNEVVLRKKVKEQR